MAPNPNQRPEERAFPGSGRRSSGRRGFTLIELLVSTAIMVIVMLVLLQVIAGMTNIWHTSTGTISTFQTARAAFTTLTRTLARATLKTYVDYVDSSGNPISETNVNGGAAYTPIASFDRSSELTFMCGPTISMTATNGNSYGAVFTKYHANYPGHCVFFQAPLGISNTTISTTDKFLQRSINTVGFYVGYDGLTQAGTLPLWLATDLGGAAAPVYRFRLYEYIEPTENVHVYNDTLAPPPWTADNNYYPSMEYISWAIDPNDSSAPAAYYSHVGQVGQLFQSTVLAENVVLLIIRPRVEPPDEQTLTANPGGLIYTNTTPAVAYSSTTGAVTVNSIISPNYNYDSRAWWGGAMTSAGSPAVFSMNNEVGGIAAPAATARITQAVYARVMRNQLPPILDVAMVAVDPNSIIHFGSMDGGTGVLPATCPLLPQPVVGATTPKKKLTYATQVNTAFPTPFSHSANMDVDLTNFGLQLSDNNIRYRIFRSSIQMEGAAWVNSY